MNSLFFRRFSSALYAAIVISALPLSARNISAPNNIEDRLDRGEVVVGMREEGTTKYVTGSVVIDEPPEKVWPIMVNPFEFRGKISPRMKEVEVVKDQANLSILKVTLDVLLIPHFNYVVESRYENGERVDFRRVGGTLKDFRGSWQMSPKHNGTQTELTYCMYIDPGFPVPQWIIREGVKSELPKTLLALRKRCNAVYHRSEAPEVRTILAAVIHRAHRAASALAATDIPETN
jgi:Polyketide cyclase / dehydrase and lipid transport